MVKKNKLYVFYCAYATMASHTMQLDAYRMWCLDKNNKDGYSYKSVVICDDMSADIYDYSNLGQSSRWCEMPMGYW